MPLPVFSALLLCSLQAGAFEGLDTLPNAIATGKTNLDLRARFELADTELPNQPKDGRLLSLRTRFGFTTGKWNNLQAAIELENLSVAADRSYNSTRNGVGNRAVIADPAGTELNQYWLRYDGIANTSIQLGRSRMALDNQRWIGPVGWRQLEQTYDAVILKNSSSKGLELNYAFITNVKSFLGTNIALHGNVVNLAWSPAPQLKLSPYLYEFDFKQNLAARYDTRTIGLRATGELPLSQAVKLNYAAEYAHQTGIDSAPDFVAADYGLLELGLAHKLVQAKLGYEVLGSNKGQYGLQTPLATLHAHNGWADLFLNTPNAGLTDASVTVTGKLKSVAVMAVAHRYQSEQGGQNLGSELGFQASYPINKQLGLLAKYARYNAGQLLVPTAASATSRLSDTEKLWLQAEYKL